MAESLPINGVNGTTNAPRGRPRPPVLIGTTGLKQWGGYLAEEFYQPLQNERGLRTYAEMASNDAVIGASLLAITLLARQVTWSVTAADDSPAAEEKATWVRGALFEDLYGGFDQLLQEILSMTWAGWSYHELVYKRRLGWSSDPWTRSRFTDGQWGWHSLPIRAQETLDHWLFDDDTNRLLGMVQRDPVMGGLYTIPTSKAALFRPQAHKGNPQGRSLLRSAYRPWYFSRRIEELQGIGIERDLVGLPVMYVPPEILDGGASADDQAVAADYRRIVTNIRRGEQEGVVLPLQYDADGNQLYKLELLSSGGQRQFDTTRVLEFYNREKTMALLTDVIVLGHERVGSLALASSKTNLLGLGISALTWSIAETFTTEVFPPLWALNGFPPETMPCLEPGDVETVDLKELGQFIRDYAQAGFDTSDLDNEIRRRAGWPPKVEDEL